MFFAYSDIWLYSPEISVSAHFHHVLDLNSLVRMTLNSDPGGDPESIVLASV